MTSSEQHPAHRHGDGAGPIDLVMPVYNEEAELPTVLGSLARQVDGSGTPLPRGGFRIVAVNNASTDRSRDILLDWASRADGPELVVVDEPRKSNVLARALGGSFALAEACRPLIVHADSDNVFPPTFIDNIARRFANGRLDVLSYLGFEPTEFWQRVPRLARLQFEEVGTISFSPETLQQFGFDERRALLTPQIFADFENVPTHCGLAMTKEIYRRVGGYVREFNPDGTERLGTARNIMFRLDLAGARLAHVLSPSVRVNPRRYLLEAEDLWAGRSYTAGMTDLRDPIRDEHFMLLDRLADRLDYETARRNFVQRFIIDPCIARPERILRNRGYFGDLSATLHGLIREFLLRHPIDVYSDARPFSDALVDAHYRTIISNMRAMRGLAQA
jgi:glycosyltransferase involved in cell wall biosynthesis